MVLSRIIIIIHLVLVIDVIVLSIIVKKKIYMAINTRYQLSIYHAIYLIAID